MHSAPQSLGSLQEQVYMGLDLFAGVLPVFLSWCSSARAEALDLQTAEA